MKMISLKGIVSSVTDKYAIVKADKGGAEYKFNLSGIPNACLNDKVDLLIKPSSDEFGLSEVLFIKSKKKEKPLKMASFSTLLAHMIKTQNRLTATLNESISDEQAIAIQEKIDWLAKGIELFSRH